MTDLKILLMACAGSKDIFTTAFLTHTFSAQAANIVAT
jgi:hypothetical protein